MEETKEQIKQAIRKYQEDHFWDCYPSGIDTILRGWVIDAIAESIVKPLQEEIEQLKAKK